MTVAMRQRESVSHEDLVGRETELDTLRAALRDDGAAVTFVHGIGGVGKTALVAAFVAQARVAGAVVLSFDGGAIEPTPGGLLASLAAATGGGFKTVKAAAVRLAELGDRVVLVIDRYEVMRALDGWLQQSLVPSLPGNVRVVLAGRERPVPGWAMGLGQEFHALALGNLPPTDARALLRREGVAEAGLDRVARLAGGHPLSLRLAAATLATRSGLEPESVADSAVVETLAERYLEGLDPLTRDALGAASVVRRPTHSLLAAMLPDAAPQDAFDRLRKLPFVTLDVDGLLLHDSVRDVVAAYLRATDPDRLRRYRVAAWRQLRDELGRAGPDELWRYTADLLYILENPMIRQVFFPTTEQRFFVDVARDDEAAAVAHEAARHLGPSATALVEAWWRRDRAAFHVARDASGELAGFYVSAELVDIGRELIEVDQVARQWRDHLRANPVARGERMLFVRFEIAGDDATASEVTAAFMLDLKRRYIELRPSLRRIYTVDRQSVLGTAWERLGFVPLPGSPPTLDDTTWHTAVLDFGPASVDGWLTRIIATELQVEDDTYLDLARRQLVLRGRRVDLTRIEFELFRDLYERPGTVVDRASLLRDVWGYADERGSNVVDAHIKSLRHKLGDRATAIQTVRGLGYRFVASG